MQFRCAVLAAALLACAPASPAHAQKSHPTLRNVAIKLFGTDAGRKVEIAPGEALPNTSGNACYEWILTFKPVKGEIELAETLTLPGYAPQWNSLEETDVSEDRTTGTTLVKVDGRLGMASHGWCVAQGDPEGRYQFTIRHGGRVISRIAFMLGNYI